MSQKSGLAKKKGKKELKKNANASSMSNKSATKKKGKDKDVPPPVPKWSFDPAESSSAPLLADEFMEKVFEQVGQIITVNETIKKLPDYNANKTVEEILWSSALRLIWPDPRVDEKYIIEPDEEPVSEFSWPQMH